MYGMWSEMLISREMVEPNQLGSIDTTSLMSGEIGRSVNYLSNTNAAVRENGYARPIEGDRISSRSDRWSYPYLESLFAVHFISTLFRELHTFRNVSSDANGWTVMFCPRNVKKPHIVGNLVIGPDTSLLQATWSFVTPAPEDKAGGEVLFAPVVVDGTLRPLLPITGRFWRQDVRRFYQEWIEHREWHVCEDEVVSACRAHR